MEPFVTVPERQKPFDVGSKATAFGTDVRAKRSRSGFAALAGKKQRFFCVIVTDSVKTLYQKTHCFSGCRRPKIHLANNGKAINFW
ncbi:hypothetical protein [Pseudomonas putida]|jgi:hypothetical protein|uniref:hypothetical protein n=1 Tax=Pseudomonas putida TaxID=303 RepID=UPI0021F83ABE|nr:hypothetical protein [Pseudomonas putida]